VELTNNLIYSKAISGVEDIWKKNSFSGLVVCENRAALLDTGNCSAVLMRGGSFKDLTHYDKKAERLLQLGIISNEKARQLSQRMGVLGESAADATKEYDMFDIEAGDTVLLYNSGLTNVLDQERMEALLSEESDAAAAANSLAKAALEGGREESVCIMVIRFGRQDQPLPEPRRYAESRSVPRRSGTEKRERRNKKQEDFRTYIAAAITCVLLAGMIFAGYILWINREGILGSHSKQEPQTTAEQSESTGPEQSETAEPQPTEAAVGNNDGEPTKDGTNPDPAPDSWKEPIKYTVKSGDSLQKISKRFYNDISKYELIMKYNNIKDPNDIKIGQVLLIPPIEGMQQP
jgi:PPM family protein phosphatase